ncbi:ATP-binding cassette domain-containing protein [Streptomyces sp. NBC_00306]|uniref:ATP-binding cassette domain-containing protein n=1 Tax=Streptomyces sp. NBC_00306 TaxID=2975708 RepID=UPI002E27F109|nr:ATP-binding cassette domain-containing protein [Streptomyces sp. NBC_00306]
MIEVGSLTRRYGTTVAVDGLSFDVRPGTVTGILGTDGSGKSTTTRLILGLDGPDAGHVRINSRPIWRALLAAVRGRGAVRSPLLPPRSQRPTPSGALAAGGGMDPSRVGEVLGTVGIAGVARRRAGAFSLGMAQQLGIAGVLLRDPGVLLLDEPVNGLDPEGVRWISNLMRSPVARAP